MLKPLFWISLAAILYTYVGYPLAIWMLARFCPRRVAKAPITPRLSVVVACLNEEPNIGARLQNLLQSDYPRELLEIIVVSDGSTDGTAAVAEGAAQAAGDGRIRVFAYPGRRGKPTALNLGVCEARGEVIVFADARQRFEPQALKHLAANFADATVGAVSGAYRLGGNAHSTVGEGVGLYWKYEDLIRRSEARFHSVIGATGAIYAIRRELWRPLPTETILDDVYTPMQIALGGYRVVFEANAVAHDCVAPSAAREFARKARTLMGNYQLCQLMPRLALPTNRLLWQFASHKLLRLAAPFFLLLLLVANLLIIEASAPLDVSFYLATLAVQVAFYLSVFVGWGLSKTRHRVRLFNVAYVFSVMNAAALVGLWYFLFGKRNVWARSE